MTAYSLINIPGWETLVLTDAERESADRRIDELSLQAVPAELPRDKATPFRMELRRNFSRLVEEARQAGASVLCMPTKRLGDLAIPASYTVAELRNSIVDSSPDITLDSLALRSDGTAERLEVDGRPALREEMLSTPEDAAAAAPLNIARGRQIVYTVSAPNEPGSWLVFSFTTIGDGDPNSEFTDLLVRLFDAHIDTLTWAA